MYELGLSPRSLSGLTVSAWLYEQYQIAGRKTRDSFEISLITPIARWANLRISSVNSDLAHFIDRMSAVDKEALESSWRQFNEAVPLKIYTNFSHLSMGTREVLTGRSVERPSQHLGLLPLVAATSQTTTTTKDLISLAQKFGKHLRNSWPISPEQLSIELRFSFGPKVLVSIPLNSVSVENFCCLSQKFNFPIKELLLPNFNFISSSKLKLICLKSLKIN